MSLSNNTKRSLAYLHHKLPLSWRKSNKIPLFLHSVKTTKKIYLPVTIYEGQLAGNDLDFCFAYAGHETPRRAYWLKKIFRSGYSQKPIGQHFYWQIPQTVTKQYPQCALLNLELNTFSHSFFKSLPGFTIPFWMYMSIDITPPMSELHRRSKSGFSDIARLIRKNHLHHEFCRCWNQFQQFYETMHKPFILNRHNQAAVFIGDLQLKDIFHRSDFFLVKNNGTNLGGGMIEYDGQNAQLRVVGIKDGDSKYLKQGVLGSLYYFPIVELKKKGFHNVNLGGTPPFFREGLTRFKMRLLAEIIPRPQKLPKEYFRLIPLKDTLALRTFLSDNPFLFYPDEKAPKQAVFLNKETCQSPDDLYQNIKYAKCKGLIETEVYIPEDLPQVITWLNQLNLPTLIPKPFKSVFWNG
ncbi:MAG: hypothetical protein H6755_00765 [Candidatus Omnitrophica bacterium]|nr:hypothetical protein [Candidatus Omnitrophota bacterium]MCB9746920.1 hypothetical protein [Candidatus Omnitrophota bacterium]